MRCAWVLGSGGDTGAFCVPWCRRRQPESQPASLQSVLEQSRRRRDYRQGMFYNNPATGAAFQVLRTLSAAQDAFPLGWHAFGSSWHVLVFQGGVFLLLLAGQSPVEPALPHPIQLSLLDPNRIPKHGSRERQHQPAPAPSSLCCLAWKCWRMPRACRQVEIVFRYSWCPVLSVMPCSAERDREVWVHSLGPISTELWPGWDLHPVGLMQSSERC